MRADVIAAIIIIAAIVVVMIAALRNIGKGKGRNADAGMAGAAISSALSGNPAATTVITTASAEEEKR